MHWRKTARNAQRAAAEAAAAAGLPPPAKPSPPEPPDTSDLAGKSPEDMVRDLAPEAVMAIAAIMRRPSRHAQAQLRAAQTLLQYGVSEPPRKTEISGRDGNDLHVIIEYERTGAAEDPGAASGTGSSNS